MGSYTPNRKYYLIDPSQFVNVEQDINFNFKKYDEEAPYLLTYRATDSSYITGDHYLGAGYKFFKRKTNSVWVSRVDGGPIYQDVNATVQSWSTTGFTFETGYGSMDQNENRISYHVDSYTKQVTWRGRLVLNGGSSSLPLNVSTKFMSVDPSILPSVAKYFTVYGGNVSNDYLIARIYVPASNSTDLRVEFCCYGATPQPAGERFINLSTVSYPLEA